MSPTLPPRALTHSGTIKALTWGGACSMACSSTSRSRRPWSAPKRALHIYIQVIGNHMQALGVFRQHKSRAKLPSKSLCTWLVFMRRSTCT